MLLDITSKDCVPIKQEAKNRKKLAKRFNGRIAKHCIYIFRAKKVLTTKFCKTAENIATLILEIQYREQNHNR